MDGWNIREVYEPTYSQHDEQVTFPFFSALRRAMAFTDMGSRKGLVYSYCLPSESGNYAIGTTTCSACYTTDERRAKIKKILK